MTLFVTYVFYECQGKYHAQQIESKYKRKG